MKGERIKWEASVTFRVEQEGFQITSPGEPSSRRIAAWRSHTAPFTTSTPLNPSFPRQHVGKNPISNRRNKDDHHSTETNE
jgi:hypothetical protein